MISIKCRNCSHPKTLRTIYSTLSNNLRIFSCESSTFTPPSSSNQSHGELHREIRRRLENLKFAEKKRTDYGLFSQIESIAAQQYLKNDKERFKKLTEKHKALRKINKAAKKEAADASKRIILPLKAEEDSTIQPNFAESTSLDREESADADEGFFVRGDEFVEEYSPATTAEMPADEMTEPSIRYYGNLDEAVEDIEFQLPGQMSTPMEKNAKFVKNSMDIGEWASNYGTVEATEEQLNELRELNDAKCPGCGAQFHCYNQSLPGFVPLEMLKDIEKNSKKDPLHQRNDFICRRCYLLKEYNFLLNLNVCNVDYAKMMSHLRHVQEALILLIVDMTDLEGSIHRELPKIIGPHKPMIVIGNKIDLLPPDTRPGYFRHYHNSLRKAIGDAGISNQFNVLKYLLISAKTGFGIEDLITNIYQNWIGPRGVLRNDIYVIGSTNAGKSTLFNTFIQSDLCKVRAMDLMERVTTSIWPGTTMSLLKFPLMNPSQQKLELRRRRLLSMQAWAKKEEAARRLLFRKTGNPKYMVLHGIVGSTFKEKEDDLQPISPAKLIKQFNGDLTPEEELEALKEKKSKLSLNDHVFQGNCCYDTPGTVNQQQVLDLFTLKELVNIIPRQILTPRIFIVFPGQCLILGAVAAINVLESSTTTKKSMPIYVTVFASQNLKINLVASKNVDQFIEKNRGDESLGAPIGDSERLEKFPKLEGIDFEIEGSGGGQRMENGGLADIVLSSIGWALITTEAKFVKIHASTPAGRGLHLRQPPLIPYAAEYREKRIKRTSEYTIRPFSQQPEYEDLKKTTKRGNSKNRGGRANNNFNDDFEQREVANFDLA